MIYAAQSRNARVALSRLLASSGHSYLHTQGPVYKAGLGAGLFRLEHRARLTVVLASPFSEFAVARARANGIVSEQWEDKGTVGACENLLGWNRNKVEPSVSDHPLGLNKDNVAIRVSESPINCSLFITSSAVFYDPYLWARPEEQLRTENNFWVFEFAKSEDKKYDCYKLLEDHFQFLWDNSQPLIDFLGPGPGYANYKARKADFEAKCRQEPEGQNNATHTCNS